MPFTTADKSPAGGLLAKAQSAALGAAGGASQGEPCAANILAELESSGVLASGRAHLISLKAIREALGTRWPDRRAVVWDMAEISIRRRIGERDFMARLDEEMFLILTPELPPASAQVLAVGILREIITHFLGEIKTRDIVIMIASGFDGQRLDCRPLSAEELTEAINREQADPQSADALPARFAQNPAVRADPDAGQLLTLQGHRLRFSVSVSPIIDLGQVAITGHRIEPKIQFEDSRAPLSPTARLQLLPRDILQVDLATVRRGAARLASGQSSAGRPSLVLVVSFLSLSNTRARTSLIAETASLRAAFANAVIFEVADFDEGVPLDRLKEGVALIKPFCRSVFARANASADLPRSIRALGFSGLVFQSPLARSSEEDEALWLLAMSRQFEAYTGTRIAANLSSKTLLPVAGAAGLTHATITA